MRYFGGKARTWKQISKLINEVNKENKPYLEPFVGGAWVLQGVKATKRYAADANKALITLYQSLQNGWVPPDDLSKEEYNHLKALKDGSDPLTAFAGFGCSFGGKWFGGYAKSGDRNYAKNAKNSLMKKVANLGGVVFKCESYDKLNPNDMVIYCDPPYQNTTGYGAIGSFDHELFWEVMREWAKNNTVLISEYNAPEDFEPILEIKTKTDIRTKTGKENRIEKVFKLRG